MVKELMVLPPTSVHSISWSAHFNLACTAKNKTSTSNANLLQSESGNEELGASASGYEKTNRKDNVLDNKGNRATMRTHLLM
jgi:hypothetical protein